MPPRVVDGYKNASARYRAKNPERLKDYGAGYRDKNRARERARGVEYYRKNLAKRKAYNKQWREGNREKARAATREWRKNNPEKAAEAVTLWHLRRTENGGSHTKEEWIALKSAFYFCCLSCGRREPDVMLCRDHVIPVSKGGSNTIDNIQPLCKSCNSSKGAKSIDFRCLW
jgi:5-methylcytosine-specific restriction endonuclease McrA